MAVFSTFRPGVGSEAEDCAPSATKALPSVVGGQKSSSWTSMSPEAAAERRTRRPSVTQVIGGTQTDGAFAVGVRKSGQQRVRAHPREAFNTERSELAWHFRAKYGSKHADGGGNANVEPYFIETFDTVASLGLVGAEPLLESNRHRMGVHNHHEHKLLYKARVGRYLHSSIYSVFLRRIKEIRKEQFCFIRKLFNLCTDAGWNASPQYI